jgi:hypothetical protein
MYLDTTFIFKILFSFKLYVVLYFHLVLPYCQTIYLFPKFIKKEDNQFVYNVVSRDDILGVISYFKIDKSLGMDGWTVELFEVLGDDLLQVMEEVPCNSKISGGFNATFIALIPKWTVLLFITILDQFLYAIVYTRS